MIQPAKSKTNVKIAMEIKIISDYPTQIQFITKIFIDNVTCLGLRCIPLKSNYQQNSFLQLYSIKINISYFYNIKQWRYVIKFFMCHLQNYTPFNCQFKNTKQILYLNTMLKFNVDWLILRDIKTDEIKIDVTIGRKIYNFHVLMML